MSTRFFAALCLSGLLVSTMATQGASEDPEKNQAKAKVGSEQKVLQTVDHSQRVSKMIGMDVQNMKGEDLGEIEDLVMDTQTGKIRYAAISFGGFLGVGDKLFAVPLHALKLKHEGENTYFVLNVDKQRLNNAPGFNKDAWPDFGNSQFTSQVDKFYGATSTDTDKTDKEDQKDERSK